MRDRFDAARCSPARYWASAKRGYRSASPRSGDSLSASPEVAESRLTDAGRRLREALLDETAARELATLIDGSPLGTVVDVVIVAQGTALALPFELLRLADGRLLATVPGVRMRRRVSGLDRTAGAPLPGPLKILVAVAAPEESRTENAPLDIEAEMQAVLDALAGGRGRRRTGADPRGREPGPDRARALRGSVPRAASLRTRVADGDRARERGRSPGPGGRRRAGPRAAFGRAAAATDRAVRAAPGPPAAPTDWRRRSFVMARIACSRCRRR